MASRLEAPPFLHVLGSEYRYGLARDRSRLLRAYKLLYYCYAQCKLIETREPPLFFTTFSTLPSTFVFTAEQDGKPRAAVSVSVSTGFGLPCSEAFPALAEDPEFNHTAELSLVATDPRLDQGHAQSLFYWPLMSYALRFCFQRLRMRKVVTAVTDQYANMLIRQLGFRQLARIRISDITGNPISLHLVGDTAQALHQRWESEDMQSDEESGFMRYFSTEHFDEFDFPDLPKGMRETISIAPEDFQYFFAETSDVVKKLPVRVKRHLHNVYSAAGYEPFAQICFPGAPEPQARKEVRRYSYRLNAALGSGKGKTTPIVIAEISSGGFRATLLGTISPSPHIAYEVNVDLGDDRFTRLTVNCAWQKGNVGGFRIIKASEQWIDLLIEAAENADLRSTKRSENSPIETGSTGKKSGEAAKGTTRRRQVG